jgi:hypothetical protein
MISIYSITGLCIIICITNSLILHIGAKVKVSHSGGCSEDDKLKANELEKIESNERNPKRNKSKKDSGVLVCSSVIEVAVSREFAENSLATLRNKGFSREDIFRMLDKGPWVLAFDISSALSPLFDSLKNDLGLSQSQAVHIISHCPYLIAQYAHYKGRDLFATAKALLDVGYTMPRLVSDIMRFPSMLAAPPDRIRYQNYLLFHVLCLHEHHIILLLPLSYNADCIQIE